MNWIHLVLAILLFSSCDTRRNQQESAVKGIHWDAAEGLLSVYRDRQATTLRFVRIEPGSFRMGGEACPGNILQQEGPRKVRIRNAFWLAATETTRRQWHAISGEPLTDRPDEPITRVSWADVQKFIQQLNQETGAGFRLPTEAEWEYACRAGSATPWPWDGDRRQVSQHGWYAGNAGARLHPVARKKPNPWGLYDMHGNAAEWTQDASGSANRVLRGGTVLSSAAGTACTCRYHYPAADGYQYAGFRLAVD